MQFIMNAISKRLLKTNDSDSSKQQLSKNTLNSTFWVWIVSVRKLRGERKEIMEVFVNQRVWILLETSFWSEMLSMIGIIMFASLLLQDRMCSSILSSFITLLLCSISPYRWENKQAVAQSIPLPFLLAKAKYSKRFLQLLHTQS